MRPLYDRLRRALLFNRNETMLGLKFLLSTLVFLSGVAFCNNIDLYLILVWIAVSMILDIILIIKPPKLFTQITFAIDELQKYRINAAELEKYLEFCPKLNVGRTFVITVLIMLLCPITKWSAALLISLLTATIIIDPIVKFIFSIKTPFFSNNYQPHQASFEAHAYDPNYCGSKAWHASQKI